MGAAPFLLLLFFLSVATPLSASPGEDLHLLEFKRTLRNSAALDATWVGGGDPCDRKKAWRGVDCSDSGYRNVSAVLLMNLGLSGDVDVTALGKLQSLRILGLENNSFTGTMPEVNRLSYLKSLFLSGNQFSGEIPPDYFGKMGSLKKLHLARNGFSGSIPPSLAQLHNLMELFLQNNEFTGPIPDLEQATLHYVNVSFNNLHGEIPANLARFGASAFQGNPDLCGTVVGKPCQTAAAAAAAAAPGSSGSMTKWVILGVVVGILLVTILFKAKKKDDDFTMLRKENLDEVIQVNVPSTVRRSASSRRGSFSGSRRGNDGGSTSSKRSSQHGRSSNDLVVINEDKGFFGLQDLMKAAAEVLGNGGLGSSYKAVMANGVAVVVKRMRDMNKLNKEAFETEIRKLGKIKHRNILPPLAFHFRKEEKLLVTEYIPRGSLLFLLHGDRGIGHAELNWGTRLKIIKGIGRGMAFLHTEFANYELPHGNLKSSNVLLSHNYDPLLTDYALFALISNTQSVQALFAYKSPEAILYQQLSPKSDVYCLGIVILEIMTGKFPSQYLSNQKGGTDIVQGTKTAIGEGRAAELIDPELSGGATAEAVEQMERMLRIGASCTESEPAKRMEMKEVIRNIEEIKA
ncbi:receptor-like protein kinase 3 [Genlisea aurea]|uniref:Receptor-like protein kinase 3 n=1 Tax=Genlisea aurea TaxID=192259 RepID=S8CM94_9LAMI|nr:receptor-like protein kinase 3 [Genlisea aurea]